MKKDLLLALSTYFLLLIISFIVSITLGFGRAESSRELSSLLWYGRRGAMVIAAITIPWFSKKQTLSALGWKVPAQWLFFSFSIGLGLGFFNKGGFDPRVPVSIPLAIFHTFAMELFFRGYLFKTLDSSIQGLWKPILLSSFLYSLFYQTMWTTWVQPVSGKIGLGIIFFFIGTVFAYSYKKSGSFLVNWTMHILVGLKLRVFIP
jgi:hypothetical protein